MDIGGKIKCDHYVGLPAINYLLADCPRCMGTGEYGGFAPLDKGDVPLVAGFNYLEQSLKKVFSEKKRITGYGFDYDLLIGIGDSESLLQIRREVKRCVLYLKSAQQEDKNRGISYATNEEIYDVRDINIEFDVAEPRRLDITLTVIAVSGRTIDIVTNLER